MININDSVQKLQQQQLQILTFRQCLQYVNENHGYQKRLFILLASYWVVASFFLFLPFFLFRKPLYSQCQSEYHTECINRICSLYPDTIKQHVTKEQTLTYQFQLFCQYDYIRVIYKTLPDVLPIFGLLFFGALADHKGRLIAFKISWRIFTIGLIIFAATQSQILIIFGYIVASVHCFPSLLIQFVLIFQQTSGLIRIRVCLIILSSLFIGPLVLSFTQQTISNVIGIRATIAIFCTVPAFLVSLFINSIKQSPVHIYHSNKIQAFNIINQMGRVNNQPPILINFLKSTWFKHHPIKLKKVFLKLKGKLIPGLLSITFIYFNIKRTQIQLDKYTNTQLRSIIISLSSSVADITLCLLISTVIKQVNYFLKPCILLVFINFFLQYFLNGSVAIEIITIIKNIILRYLIEICYGIVLIWSINDFPTICRVRCLSIIMCGCSIGCILAYSTRKLDWWIISIIQFMFIVGLLFLEKNIKIFNGRQQLKDTMQYQAYDKDDQYVTY